MNAYYSNTHTRRYAQNDSNAIRRAYLYNDRKQSVLRFINSLAESAETKVMQRIILALKIISGIVCAISFFAVVGMIEEGSISVISGILSTIVIAALECLCFIPTASNKKYQK